LCPDPSSNNIAEFYGFRECLRRALRGAVCSHVVFELDSMLVVMFMLGMWGCHRNHLRVLLQECHDLGEALTFRGCTWTIRHVYREYNTVADRLAGQAIQESRGLTSPQW
jgi:ribonuclease HI